MATPSRPTRQKGQHHPPIKPGDKFGNLTVVAEDEPAETGRKKNRRWLMRCICGKTVSVLQYNLWPTGRGHNGQTSCGGKGCRTSFVHGRWGTPEYLAWDGMMQRCSNVRAKYYAYYGGRGIKVCPRWASFAHFFEDMGPRPGREYSIDRIDTNGDYEPGNCRWATRRQQQGNLRSNVYLEHQGKRMILADWARHLGIKLVTINARRSRGFSVEEVLTVGRVRRRSGRACYAETLPAGGKQCD